MKFSLLTIGSKASTKDASFAFFLQSPRDLEINGRIFQLSPTDIARVNPNTRTCPIFFSSRDAEITKGIYERVPVLIREGEKEENPWGISFSRMFDMSNDSNLFRTRADLEENGLLLKGNIFEGKDERYLPLYEAKMIHQFDHRWATYDGVESRDVTLAEKQNPNFEPLPRYWVAAPEVDRAIPSEWKQPWLMGWRDITNSTNERTVIASLVPRVAVGHTMPIMMTEHPNLEQCLLANLNSMVLDYVARQKIGGTHLTYGFLKQFPILTPSAYWGVNPWQQGATLFKFISDKVDALLACSTLLNLALSKKKGALFDAGWDINRRAQLRAELDAAFFHLYGIERNDVEYVLDQFPGLRRNNEKEFGEFRTKRLVLAEFDKLADLATKQAINA